MKLPVSSLLAKKTIWWDPGTLTALLYIGGLASLQLLLSPCSIQRSAPLQDPSPELIIDRRDKWPRPCDCCMLHCTIEAPLRVATDHYFVIHVAKQAPLPAVHEIWTEADVMDTSIIELYHVSDRPCVDSCREFTELYWCYFLFCLCLCVGL